MICQAASYYATNSPTSEIDRHAWSVQSSIALNEKTAAAIARNSVIHFRLLSALGVSPSAANTQDRDTRSATRILDRVFSLSSKPLEEQRIPAHRMVGNCQHVALLACAFLRYAGVPARVRCGFAPYLGTGTLDDHWLAEVWLDDGWRRFDPDMGLEVGDPVLDDFVCAPDAWRAYRRGQCDPEGLGSGDERGSWFIRNNLVRDFAALCKVELHPGDWWGAMIAEDPESTDGVLDEIAHLACSDEYLMQRLDRFEVDPAVNPFGRVLNFDFGFREIPLPTRW